MGIMLLYVAGRLDDKDLGGRQNQLKRPKFRISRRFCAPNCLWEYGSVCTKSGVVIPLWDWGLVLEEQSQRHSVTVLLKE